MEPSNFSRCQRLPEQGQQPKQWFLSCSYHRGGLFTQRKIPVRITPVSSSSSRPEDFSERAVRKANRRSTSPIQKVSTGGTRACRIPEIHSLRKTGRKVFPFLEPSVSPGPGSMSGTSEPECLSSHERPHQEMLSTPHTLAI